jgi:hypothetical protein
VARIFVFVPAPPTAQKHFPDTLLATVGDTRTVRWQTGQLPEESGSIGVYPQNDKTGDNAVKFLNIALKRVAVAASTEGDVTALQSLLDAVQHFKKYGVEDGDILAVGVAAKMRRKPK